MDSLAFYFFFFLHSCKDPKCHPLRLSNLDTLHQNTTSYNDSRYFFNCRSLIHLLFFWWACSRPTLPVRIDICQLLRGDRRHELVLVALLVMWLSPYCCPLFNDLKLRQIIKSDPLCAAPARSRKCLYDLFCEKLLAVVSYGMIESVDVKMCQRAKAQKSHLSMFLLLAFQWSVPIVWRSEASRGAVCANA